MEPKVLLLDEPLSNLDAKLRVSTRMEIRKLQQRLGITTVYVTHDQEEAMTLSDRVVIMYAGKIQQIGSPREIYARPVSRFVAGFIGKANFVESRVSASGEGSATVMVAGKQVVVPTPQRRFEVDERVIVLLRPESIVVGPPTPDGIKGKVLESVYLGSEVLYGVQIGEVVLSADESDPEEREVYEVGASVGISLRERNLHLLPYEE
jgi:iron(III) transport system ATP-binding protein